MRVCVMGEQYILAHHDFCVKFDYKGYEISATPRDGVNIYPKGDEMARPIQMIHTGNVLIDICTAKTVIDDL